MLMYIFLSWLIIGLIVGIANLIYQYFNVGAIYVCDIGMFFICILCGYFSLFIGLFSIYKKYENTIIIKRKS